MCQHTWLAHLLNITMYTPQLSLSVARTHRHTHTDRYDVYLNRVRLEHGFFFHVLYVDNCRSSYFHVPQLLNSSLAGLHCFPLKLSLSYALVKNNISPSLLFCPVQSFGSWISHARCIWWAAANTIPVDHYSTPGVWYEPAGSEENGKWAERWNEI